MCGEKMMKAGSNCAMLGSPPRMRGKVEIDRENPRVERITPACAGKSGSLRFSTARCRDHPRMCGEKLLVLPLVGWLLGSPPHVRGKAIFCVLCYT